MGRLRNLIPMLFSVVWISCSWLSGPKYEIIVEYTDLPFEEYAFVHSPRWAEDGSSIYFVACKLFDGAVFRYDLATETLEEITPRRDFNGGAFALSHVSDKLAYDTWYVTPENDTDYVIVHLCDLEGNPLDSFMLPGYFITQMRFSEVNDSFLYITLEPSSYLWGYYFLRLNLNTGAPPDTLLTFLYGDGFDLFPDDTAFLMHDTIYSLTSDSKRKAGLAEYSDISLNPQDPHYVAADWPTHEFPPFLRYGNTIVFTNLLDRSSFEITACPRDRKKIDYYGANNPEFSPDGNSVAYIIDSYQESSSRQEIGLITNVFDE